MKAFLFSGGFMETETTDIISGYLSEEGVETVVSEDTGDFLGGSFQEADLLILNSCVWSGIQQEIRTPEREAILSHLRRGKGAIVLHSSLGNWDDWPEFIQVGGAVWNWSRSKHTSPDSTFTVERMGAHPLTEGIPSTFEITDEMYYELDVVPGNQVLLQSVSEIGTNPVLWYREVEGGRVVTNVLGHDRRACTNKHYRQLLINAVHWLKGGKES